MTSDQILALRSELSCYLEQFADCFGRVEPRLHLRHYLRGQLSDLPRKSVEPIALFNNVAPRTLQEFLASDAWDHGKLRDRMDVPAQISPAELEKLALANERVQEHLTGKQIKKVIVVPGKLVNIAAS